MRHSKPFFALTRVPAMLAACLGIVVGWQNGRGAESSSSAESGIDWKREQQFWSFKPPVKPARPAGKSSRWPKEDLDFFVLSRLEGKNLAPTREASKQTLVRRVTFDLTGLPPTPEEADAFARGRRPDAYAKLL